jgi:hypothetical protein
MPQSTPNLRFINSEANLSPLPEDFFSYKQAYTTRNIDTSRAYHLQSGEVHPHRGDLVLAEVLRIGQHTRIELGSGRRARMHVGDRILVCYGERYAPDQFEASLPLDLGDCHLVAAGGIAAQMESRHSRMKRPTVIRPLGLVVDVRGERINLRDSRLPHRGVPTQRPMTVAVAGTSMNAGKTTAAAHLIKGLDRAGMKVGAAKITGTGAGCDFWFMADSGASPVLDFTHAGHASTFGLTLKQLEDIMETLIAELASRQPDAIVLEIADGIFQQETAAILASDCFRRLVDKMLFTACDATGALTGKLWLEQQRLPLVAISGALTASPLAAREAEQATGMQVFDMDQLADAELSTALVFDNIALDKKETA